MSNAGNAAWIKKIQDIPLDYVLWETTARCNLACLHCRADASPDKRSNHDLTTKQGEGLLSELSKIKVKALVLTGGEPLLRSDIAHLVAYATDLGIRVRLQSNGLLLNDKLAQDLKTAGLISFGVGLDAHESATHDKIRRKEGAFEGALASIRCAKAAGLNVHVEFTCTQLNRHCVSDLVDLLTKLKVDTLLARSAIFCGRATETDEIFLLTPAQYKMFLEEVRDASEEQNLIIINSQDPLYRLVNRQYGKLARETKKSNPERTVLSGCSVGLNMAHIHSNGDVGFCTFLPDITIGNVKTDSFLSVWRRRANNHPELVGRALSGSCGSCSTRLLCGGCRARARALGGGILGEDPYCWLHWEGRANQNAT